MKAVRLLALVCFFSVSLLSWGEEVPTDLRLEAELEQLSRQFDAPFVPEEALRVELVGYMRQKLEAARKTPEAYAAQFVARLIQLRDEEIIRGLTRDQVLREFRQELSRCGSPVAIEVVAPVMFIEEPLEVGFVADVPTLSESHKAAAHTIPFMISRTPAFSDELRNWAERFMKSEAQPSYDFVRASMRAWWRANEHHFRTRNYAAVGLPNLPVPEPTPAPPPLPEPQPATEPALPREEDSPLQEQRPQPSKRAEGPNIYIGLAILCMIGLGTFVYWSWGRRHAQKR